MAASPTERLDDHDDRLNEHAERLARAETHNTHIIEGLGRLEEGLKGLAMKFDSRLGSIHKKLDRVIENCERQLETARQLCELKIVDLKTSLWRWVGVWIGAPACLVAVVILIRFAL